MVNDSVDWTAIAAWVVVPLAVFALGLERYRRAETGHLRRARTVGFASAGAVAVIALAVALWAPTETVKAVGMLYTLAAVGFGLRFSWIADKAEERREQESALDAARRERSLEERLERIHAQLESNIVADAVRAKARGKSSMEATELKVRALMLVRLMNQFLVADDVRAYSDEAIVQEYEALFHVDVLKIRGDLAEIGLTDPNLDQFSVRQTDRATVMATAVAIERLGEKIAEDPEYMRDAENPGASALERYLGWMRREFEALHQSVEEMRATKDTAKADALALASEILTFARAREVSAENPEQRLREMNRRPLGPLFLVGEYARELGAITRDQTTYNEATVRLYKERFLEPVQWAWTRVSGPARARDKSLDHLVHHGITEPHQMRAVGNYLRALAGGVADDD